MLKTNQDCNSGYNIGDHILSNLSYADDIAAVDTNLTDLQIFINKLAENAKEVGLTINLSKTVCMTTDKPKPLLNVTIYNKPIKQVTEFIYLGHKLSASYDHLPAVNHRIGLRWAAISKHAHVLKSRMVPLSIKTKMYEIYIRPVVMYGLDCIPWTQSLINKREMFQNHFMRMITGHKLMDRVNISSLYQSTNLHPLFNQIKSKSLKLFGHTKRSSQGVAKICLEDIVCGKRNKGRPKRRWRDNILTWSKCANWSEINTLVTDRQSWRSVSHVSSQSTAACGRWKQRYMMMTSDQRVSNQ